MAGKTSEQTIFLEGANITWGKEQCRAITLVDDVAGSLEGEYFDLNVLDSSKVETNYYVLLDGGTAVDPAPAGKTKITVLYTDNDSASVIAGLMQVAINAATDITATVDGAIVTALNDEIGMVTDEVITNAASLSFEVISGTGGDLGKTAEGIEITIETQSTEIQANQTGLIVIDEIFQGQTASCTAAFLELTKERMEYIIAGAVGGTFTPSGGTKMIGGGSSRLFESLKASGGKLIIHPQRLPLTDRSRDFVFWISAPKPESINYSGTDVQVLNVTFTAYLDEAKPAEISLFEIGDWKQTLV